ncbi:MAG TPA: hypothetical protein DCZ63_09985 [Geobacter sp.]|nr:hypothetical protein [Geobacter sp.]
MVKAVVEKISGVDQLSAGNTVAADVAQKSSACGINHLDGALEGIGYVDAAEGFVILGVFEGDALGGGKFERSGTKGADAGLIYSGGGVKLDLACESIDNGQSIGELFIADAGWPHELADRPADGTKAVGGLAGGGYAGADRGIGGVENLNTAVQTVGYVNIADAVNGNAVGTGKGSEL